MRRVGFSLVELMIVVAIIGILAAIAIPNFRTMQLKSKRAEVAPNVAGLRTQVLSYDMANDTYVALPQNPTGTPGKAARPFGVDADWSRVGWVPDGEVRGVYAVTLSGPTDFEVHGWSDVDGNSEFFDVRATKTTTPVIDAGDESVY